MIMSLFIIANTPGKMAGRYPSQGEKPARSVFAESQNFSHYPAIYGLYSAQCAMGTDLDATVTPDACVIIEPDLSFFACYGAGRAVFPAFTT